jgi:hypothetical protein
MYKNIKAPQLGQILLQQRSSLEDLEECGCGFLLDGKKAMSEIISSGQFHF